MAHRWRSPEELLDEMVEERDALRLEVARLQLLLQRWRFESHPGGCPCKKCADTAEALPGVPYCPGEEVA